MDVLYKQKQHDPPEEEQEDLLEDEEEDEKEEGDDWQEEVPEEDFALHDNYEEALKKVRRIVRFFRKSPTKNDTLQRIAKEEGHKELTLCLDTKTRWNSMVKMIRRFLDLKSSVIRALIEFSSFDLFPSQDQLSMLSDLSDSLEVVEVAAQALGRRDSDMGKAERIFEFLLKNLREQNSTIGSKLFDTVLNRVTERRNECLSALFLYLEDPTSYENEDGLLRRPSLQDLSKTARDLHLRLFKEDDSEEDANDETIESEDEPPKKLSKAEELEEVLSGKKKIAEKKKPRCTSQGLLQNLKREMAVFESSGDRPSSLEKLYRALLSLPPSSIEAERSFSAAGLFVTKLRTSLNDETIDTLCFLRAYLMKKPSK